MTREEITEQTLQKRNEIIRLMETGEYNIKQIADKVGLSLSGIQRQLKLRKECERANTVMRYSLMSPQVAKHLLEGYMRDLSESHLQNGWTQDTEFVLYRATWGGPEHWGNYMIGQMDCDVMQELSESAMGWFSWDRSKGVHFVPETEWMKKYSEWESQQQQDQQKKAKLIFDLAELAAKRVREGGTI